MSDYASVLLTWSSTGDDDNLEDGDYQAKYKKALEDVAATIGGSVNAIIWGCGAGGETMVCENVAQLCVNHFLPELIWSAIQKAAYFLADDAEELEVFYKTEDDERYAYLPRLRS